METQVGFIFGYRLSFDLSLSLCLSVSLSLCLSVWDGFGVFFSRVLVCGKDQGLQGEAPGFG